MDNILQIRLGDLLIATIPLVVVLWVLIWLLKQWIGVRLDKSIQHEYDKRLEDYKDSRIKRQKAELIAELFSKWIKYYGRETTLLTNMELMEHYEILNRLSLELTLWMDNEEIYQNIMNRLQNLDGARDLRDLVGDVRAFLLEKDRASFNSQNIVLWPLPNEIDRIYGSRPQSGHETSE